MMTPTVTGVHSNDDKEITNLASGLNLQQDLCTEGESQFEELERNIIPLTQDFVGLTIKIIDCVKPVS